jgi:type I restriction-modification system DNA methylase subunit
MSKTIHDYVDNNLFSRHYLDKELRLKFDVAAAQPVFDWACANFDAQKLEKISEAQLESEFVAPILEKIGYQFINQLHKQVFGKTIIPDYALFANKEEKNAQYDSQRADAQGAIALCEAKAYAVDLDNKKIDLKNPHFQLIDYLTKLRVNIGLLTNGRHWRFYNVSQNVASKVFFELHLDKIILEKDFDAFLYFYTIFGVAAFAKSAETEKIPTVRHELLERNRLAIEEIERDLKAVIYGKDSIVELFGQSLYQRTGAAADLGEVYQNSVTFCFRLLFVAYFEDKFNDTLFEQHLYYGRKSLHQLLARIGDENVYIDEHYLAWSELHHLFNILDRGDDNLNIPLLNGGLFSPSKARLLQQSKAINNRDLRRLLQQLLQVGKSRRDFRTLSVQHLGNIYEGLLEFEFREVVDSALYYLTYSEGSKNIEGYFDSYDYGELKKNKKISHIEEVKYKKGDIYFSDRSSNRKTTASYYTPPAFTQYMAQEAIAEAEKQEPNLLNWRILDNACGSGHFLIETLDQVTRRAFDKIGNEQDNDAPTLLLRQTFEAEKIAVAAAVAETLGEAVAIDELSLLKRLMLKKVIYGLDLNPFAVELTRLSLWLDTFVIGTPLSFIEHHIRRGNALIGSTKTELIAALGQNNLFAESIKNQINDLVGQLLVINDLRDNNAADIAASKATFERISPALSRLNSILNLVTFEKMLPFIYDKSEAKQWGSLVKSALDQPQAFIQSDPTDTLNQEIAKAADLYQFFNYEIAFAEAFATPSDSGFHIVIGNPPWDKTKFDESEFFSVWRSAYRSAINSRKQEMRDEVLSYPYAVREYEARKKYINNTNDYFKTYFPLNRGAGDNNLFRLFLEHNLRLLTPKGSLNYLTPSAWSYEDSSLQLRQHIFEQYQTKYFYQFENREKIFDRVDSRYKFAVFQLLPNAEPTNNTTIKTRFMQTDVNILRGQEGVISYPIADIRGLSPHHSSLFEVRQATDLGILRKLYAAFAPINPDYMDFRRELDMTNDRDIFLETCSTAIDWPLYEGKMIQQYNANYAPAKYWVNAETLRKRLLSVETSRLIGDIYEQLPEADKRKGKRESVLQHLGLADERELAPHLDFDYNYPRLAFRGIARNTDERTLITALLPAFSTFGHSMMANTTHKYILNAANQIESRPISTARLLLVQAVFNSLLADFFIRLLVDINVSKTYLMRLPMPQPSDAELLANPKYVRIVRLAAILNLNVMGIAAYGDLAASLGITSADLPKNEKQRARLSIEIDVLVAQLYGISSAELAHLTSPTYFKIFNEQQAGYLSALLEAFDNDF